MSGCKVAHRLLIRAAGSARQAQAAQGGFSTPLQLLPGSFVANPCRGFASSASAELQQSAPQLQHPQPQYTPLQQQLQGQLRPRSLPVFAVVEMGPTQHKVTVDDLVYTERIRGADVNELVTFNRVLMLGSEQETVVGRPHVPGASVEAVVEEHFLDAKVLIFKKRRRKHSRRLTGHRQELTAVRIKHIGGIQPA